MHTIRVNLKKYPYAIIAGSDILRLLGKYITRLNIGKDAYIITNKQIRSKWGSALNRSLRLYGINIKFRDIPDTEKSKSMDMATHLITDIARYDKGRQTFIIAFGGGVVGDVAGFIASIYKRGIPYIQVPTTLLAQVDSSIGGKTAVDLAQGKNLVGAFYHPRLVFSDIKFLKTLRIRQISSGLSEVIKYAVIKDRQLFLYLEKRYKDILALRPSSLEYIVKASSLIKTNIVGCDEREEKGIRTILNFGHTVGHAIEAASNFKGYNHGEAIALGMLVAGDISMELGLISDIEIQKIENLIKAVGLPVKIKNVSVAGIINAHYRDKKFIGQRNRFVLLKEIGETKIVENIPLGVIKLAIRKRI
ncbi:MAG: 3-dehydroquinate synthase [Candidatus Omnitrophica bacterium]|nr:3-dehydroquinate synthase [Candidatus Omnitrophota bacterium]